VKLVSTRSQNMIRDFSGLCRDLVEVSALLGCMRTLCCLLDNVVSGQHIGHTWKAILKMGMMCCPETSVTSYQHIQCNIPHERRPQNVIYLHFKDLLQRKVCVVPVQHSDCIPYLTNISVAAVRTSGFRLSVSTCLRPWIIVKISKSMIIRGNATTSAAIH